MPTRSVDATPRACCKDDDFLEDVMVCTDHAQDQVFVDAVKGQTSNEFVVRPKALRSALARCLRGMASPAPYAGNGQSVRHQGCGNVALP